MTASPATRYLVRQTAGAIPWAAFFILAPFLEFVFLGAVLWLPLLIWRERRRAQRYGFLPGALCRAAVVAVIVTTAILAPTGPNERLIRGLPSPTVTLGELDAAGVVILSSYDKYLDPVTLTLPAAERTRPQLVQAITEQTGLRARMMGCGVGATLLFGARRAPIFVYDPRPLRERQVARQGT